MRNFTKGSLCALLLGLSSIAQASELTKPYPELLLDDIQHVLTEPARWQSTEWQTFGWASFAVVATAAIIDAPLRDEMRRQPKDNSFMNIERFGAEYSVGVVAGFYLVGNLVENEKAVSVAQDSLTASIIASGLITPAIKIAAGRSRPYEDLGTNNFKSLGADNPNSSFPSGHTTEAFALASVISSHYEEIWIKVTAYTVASLVGIARTYHDAHFASDVLAGAFIGNWVGLSVVSYHQQKQGANIMLRPEITQDIIGLHLAGNL
jgi:membrane-associated phospholipid phosphatase